MPYRDFTKKEEGKTKYCMEAIRTGKTYCYDSPAAREKAKSMHEAFTHGFRPTRKKETADEWLKKKSKWKKSVDNKMRTFGDINYEKKKSKWKKSVDNKMRTFGDINYEKKKIRINPKKGDVIDSIIHENLHKTYPNMTEKQIKNKAAQKNKELSLRKKIQLLKEYV